MGIRIIVSNADFSANAVKQVELISSVIDSDAEKFLQHVVSVDPTFNTELYEQPVNILVQKLKLYGMFYKIDYFYPFLGVTKESQGVSLKNPGENDIKFYVRTNATEPTNDPSEFTTEGYKSFNVSPLISDITKHNVGHIRLTDRILNHPADLTILSTNCNIKDNLDRTASGNMMFGNYTTKTNRYNMGNTSDDGGIGSGFPPSTIMNTYTSVNKRTFTYSLKNGKFSVYQNKVRVVADVPVSPIYKEMFTSEHLGVGLLTNTTLKFTDGELNIGESSWATNNFSGNILIDNLLLSRAFDGTEVALFMSIMSEFRAAIGRLAAE